MRMQTWMDSKTRTQRVRITSKNELIEVVSGDRATYEECLLDILTVIWEDYVELYAAELDKELEDVV